MTTPRADISTDTPALDRWAPWLAALAIFAGTIVRFHDLSSIGISHWDAGTYTAAPLEVGPYGRREILPFYAPPLVPALNGLGFDLFGPKDTVAIAIAAAIGSLTLLAIYRLGAELLGKPAAAFATAAYAAMEYALVYSRQPLTDGPYLLFFTLSVTALAAGLRSGRARSFVIGGLWSGAALLTKYHGFFPLVVLAMVTALSSLGWGGGGPSREPLRRGWKGSWIAGGVVLIPLALLLIWISRTVGIPEFRANRSQWLPDPGLYLVPQTARYVLACLTHWISPITLMMGAAGFVWMLVARRREHLWILAWAALFSATLPMYKNYPRLPLPLTIPIALAAGLAISRLLAVWEHRGHARQAVIASFGAAIVLFGAELWRSRDTLAVTDRGYARAAEVLVADPVSEGRDLLVTQHAILMYLLDSKREPICYDEPGAFELLESGNVRYLVVDLRTIHAPRFRAYLDSSSDSLELVEEIPNPLNEASLVNCAGFEALEETDPEVLTELETIRIYRHRPDLR
ncbi:MAG: glycosyltransferase family 39 protein [Planctomycetota bacterium]